MLELKELNLKDKKIWDELVRNTPESGFMQSWAWGELKASQYQNVARFGVFEGAVLVAGAAVYYVDTSFGASALEIPHGPVLPWKDRAKARASYAVLFDGIRELARKVNAAMVRIEPFITEGMPDYIQKFKRAPIDLLPTPTLVVPVTGSDEEILNAMQHKGRYNIKLSEKRGVEVVSSDGESLVEDFYELFELTYTRHNFQGEPIGYMESIMSRLKDDNMARIYVAKYKGISISAALAIFFGERATYLYGGSLPFLTSTMASYCLHWQVIKDARGRGCKYYDMFGIAPDGALYHPYSNFTQFKTRFGGIMLNTVGAHDMYFYPQLADMWAASLKT